jgi:16S rRNA C967 or C1407 C5-methylase (RsmB/RsmF family)
MSHKHTLTKGRVAFLEYYSKLLPQFSIPELTVYLNTRNTPVLLISKIFETKLMKLWQENRLSWIPLRWFPYALQWPPEIPVGETLPGFSEGWIYPLNKSSLLPVLLLSPRIGENILDAAAAPGGKTLSIANQIDLNKTLLIANDPSFPRFKRLRTALKFFGFPDIPTWRFPAQTIARNSEYTFDKILLDAPCSSEKHVFNSKKHLKIWSPNRIKKLSELQLSLIESLLPLLRSGGTLIYSTCALTPEENETVIAKILEKHPLEIALKNLPDGLPIQGSGLPEFGLKENQCKQVLRINNNDFGFDPMFVAGLRKI